MDEIYSYITEQGLYVADTSAIQEEVFAEYRALLGDDIDLSPSEPQGALAAAEVLARANLAQSNVDLANQINPNLAGGGWLDALCALLGLERNEATPSVILNVQVTGIPSTTIPAGSRAKTTDGDLFKTITSVILDNAGNATVTFQSVENGPIPCLANTLTSIVDNVLGWETVDNPDPAILGTNTETDLALRKRRKLTLALQGASTPEAIVSRLNDVPGVLSLKFLENVTDSPAVIEGVNLVAHSIWACVDGGTDDDVGFAILDGKSSGSNFNGAVMVQVEEPNSLQIYDVYFDRPVEVTIWLRITIRVITSLSDPTTTVTNAALAWANNQVQDIDGFLVGLDVSPFEGAAAIQNQVSGIYIQTVEVSDDGATWQTTTYDIASDEVGRLTSGRVSVVIV